MVLFIKPGILKPFSARDPFKCDFLSEDLYNKKIQLFKYQAHYFNVYNTKVSFLHQNCEKLPRLLLEVKTCPPLIPVSNPTHSLKYSLGQWPLVSRNIIYVGPSRPVVLNCLLLNGTGARLEDIAFTVATPITSWFNGQNILHHHPPNHLLS